MPITSCFSQILLQNWSPSLILIKSLRIDQSSKCILRLKEIYSTTMLTSNVLDFTELLDVYLLIELIPIHWPDVSMTIRHIKNWKINKIPTIPTRRLLITSRLFCRTTMRNTIHSWDFKKLSQAKRKSKSISSNQISGMFAL